MTTLPETNMSPENRPLEKEIPIGNHHFKGQTVSFREGRCWQNGADDPQVCFGSWQCFAVFSDALKNDVPSNLMLKSIMKRVWYNMNFKSRKS